MLPREPSWKKVREGTVYPGNFDILQKEGLFDSTGGGGGSVVAQTGTEIA